MTYKDFIETIIKQRGQWNIPEGIYYEAHHILPKCLGGLPKGNIHKLKHKNIIWLLPEEHFIAHKLLALENPKNVKLVRAWFRMSWIENKEITPEEYSLLRSSMKHSEEDKIKMRKHHKGQVWNKGLTKETDVRLTHKLSEESKKKISISLSGKSKTELHKLHMRHKRGPIKSEEIRYKMGNSTRDTTWYTNGTINIRSKECPDGFYKGRTIDASKQILAMRQTRSKKVLCIETNIIYYSAQEAERQTGDKHILDVCHNKRSPKKNKYHWKEIINE